MTKDDLTKEDPFSLLHYYEKHIQFITKKWSSYININQIFFLNIKERLKNSLQSHRRNKFLFRICFRVYASASLKCISIFLIH
jgi:hypothetical protein